MCEQNILSSSSSSALVNIPFEKPLRFQNIPFRCFTTTKSMAFQHFLIESFGTDEQATDNKKKKTEIFEKFVDNCDKTMIILIQLLVKLHVNIRGMRITRPRHLWLTSYRQTCVIDASNKNRWRRCQIPSLAFWHSIVKAFSFFYLISDATTNCDDDNDWHKFMRKYYKYFNTFHVCNERTYAHIYTWCSLFAHDKILVNFRTLTFNIKLTGNPH